MTNQQYAAQVLEELLGKSVAYVDGSVTVKAGLIEAKIKELRGEDEVSK